MRDPKRVAAFILVVASSWLALPARSDEPPTYERDIKPLFAKRCTVCHNRRKLDDLEVSAGLALDSFEAALAGTKEHKVITPGRSSESELWRRLNESDE